MKKALFLLSSLFLLAGCAEPEPELPPADPQTYSVKLNKANGGLEGTTKSAPSTEEKVIQLSIEGKTEKYEIIMGPNLYNHADYDEIVMMNGGYIKSKSQYTVDRLRIDYFSGKGTNFEVLNASEQVVQKHESSVPTDFPGDTDKGEVLEYPINGTSWTIRNTSEFKPAFYSITVLFTL